jgi:hypothetical protein
MGACQIPYSQLPNSQGLLPKLFVLAKLLVPTYKIPIYYFSNYQFLITKLTAHSCRIFNS